MTLDELVERLLELQAEGHGSRSVYAEDESCAYEVSGVGLHQLVKTGAGLDWFLDSGRSLPWNVSVDQCDRVVRIESV